MILQTRVPADRCGQEGARASAPQGDFPWAQAPRRPQDRHSYALAAESSIRLGPAAPHMLALPLLHVKGWERTPGPTLPVTKWCHQVPRSYRDMPHFSSTTKATFKSLYDIFIGTDYKDGSILFREAQNRCTRDSGEPTDFCFKDITAEDSKEHLVCFTSPLLSREIQQAHAGL